MGMEKRAARRMGAVMPSATVMVSDKARSLAQEGVDVINLGGGDPDFDTPAHIVEAAEEAIRAGHTHYVSSRGVKELLAALAQKLKTENGLDFDPATEIIVSPGAKMSLFTVMMAMVDEGDEVLILDPFWVSYEPMVQLANATPVRVPLDKADNFRVTGEVLRRKVTPETKMLIFNSPNNPTGRVLNQEELQAIADVATENDLLVISDEIYERIIYDGNEPVSIGTFPGMEDRTIVVNGFSKTYAMTGWRLGYAAARANLTTEILKVQQHAATCAPSFVQHAGIVALDGPQDVVTDMVDIYAQRRDIITDGLNDLPGVTCRPIEGAFYAFPDISGTGMSSLEFADFLLDKAGVAVTPGMAFGTSGEGHVRLSFANSTELVEKAMQRMKEAL